MSTDPNPYVQNISFRLLPDGVEVLGLGSSPRSMVTMQASGVDLVTLELKTFYTHISQLTVDFDGVVREAATDEIATVSLGE